MNYNSIADLVETQFRGYEKSTKDWSGCILSVTGLFFGVKNIIKEYRAAANNDP
jgi:hypothetical protein